MGSKRIPSAQEIERTRKAAVALAAEQRVADVFERLGWTVDRNIHYDDLTEGKRREMDVIATRAWDRADGRAVMVRLELVVEVKSMSGAQILVSEDSAHQYGERCYFSWVGYDDDEVRDAVRRAIEGAGAPPEVAARTMELFHELAYPAPENRSDVIDLIADAPKPPHYGSSVRFSTETDDDVSSFAYNGVRMALSCVESLSRAATASEIDNLRSDIRAALGDSDAEILIRGALQSAISVITLFHPLVVTGALLWTVDHEAITRTPWCRIQDKTREDSRWVDMVSVDHLDDFAVSVTGWYDQIFRPPTEVKTVRKRTRKKPARLRK